MYQSASTGDDPGQMRPSAAGASGMALDHMIAALKLLDETDISPAVGARLEQALELLREELAKNS